MNDVVREHFALAAAHVDQARLLLDYDETAGPDVRTLAQAAGEALDAAGEALHALAAATTCAGGPS